jgi:PIN domain nuclease of toxin-antitoxin system
LKLLPDTHAVLWWLADDPRFGARAARELVNGRNQVLLSAVVIWEVAIKRGLGKLDAPEDLVDTLVQAGAGPLPITLGHAAALEALPLHHRDPFDRLLIAQAQIEQAALVSRGPYFPGYGVPLIWE